MAKISSRRCKSRYWTPVSLHCPFPTLFCTLAVAEYELSTRSKDLHRKRTLKGRTGQSFQVGVRSSRNFPAGGEAVDLSWKQAVGGQSVISWGYDWIDRLIWLLINVFDWLTDWCRLISCWLECTYNLCMWKITWESISSNLAISYSPLYTLLYTSTREY
jgi:hypothetical protein